MWDKLNDEKTNEFPNEIEEHWVELKRRTRTRMFRERRKATIAAGWSRFSPRWMEPELAR